MLNDSRSSMPIQWGRPSVPDPEPPPYDTLTIGSPEADLESAERESNSHSGGRAAAHEKNKSLKQKWRDMMEEERRRKDARIQHVTPEEADRITGLDRRRAEETNDTARKGTKSFLALMLLS
ncbi:hypothetical protein SCAR479_07743 [Seiridium cardinale]|uniref:Uncharacterized protein n=1 Tax=Seiridium cardinale TaxID=138064 RepID=A0ABR2XPB1_9PEZI